MSRTKSCISKYGDKVLYLLLSEYHGPVWLAVVWSANDIHLPNGDNILLPQYSLIHDLAPYVSMENLIPSRYYNLFYIYINDFKRKTVLI